ncbi:hypothetical protein AB0H82_16780 [Streptomyces sp. NPDC050732]|uniref:hypothetical protein n=1 Tax=Streptomyces sp. NPDC050732 TaxID=3154632 RepID=UPI00342151FE
MRATIGIGRHIRPTPQDERRPRVEYAISPHVIVVIALVAVIAVIAVAVFQ